MANVEDAAADDFRKRWEDYH